jgi:hypothetical protein
VLVSVSILLKMSKNKKCFSKPTFEKILTFHFAGGRFLKYIYLKKVKNKIDLKMRFSFLDIFSKILTLIDRLILLPHMKS